MDIDTNAVIKGISARADLSGTYKGPDGLLYCQECGEPRQTHLIRGKFDGIVSRRCKCDKARTADRENREDADRKERNRNTCFAENTEGKSAKFEDSMDYNPEQRQMCRNYADHFGTFLHGGADVQQGLILYGTVGSGKSFLAGCIANRVIDQGFTALYTTFEAIEARMREDKEQATKELLRPSLLIIDDLGAERGTEYMNGIVYSVVNDRVNSHRPMIVTTNLTKADLLSTGDIKTSRIYDRLLKACVPIEITGKSIRRDQFKARYYNTMSILKGETQ